MAPADPVDPEPSLGLERAHGALSGLTELAAIATDVVSGSAETNLQVANGLARVARRDRIGQVM
ncbi:MAG: hypothetical protein M5U31_04280 [Acidimicrobiia bacterium]|nr:hypothetical protein [Acidimicrobiia bacterium]